MASSVKRYKIQACSPSSKLPHSDHQFPFPLPIPIKAWTLRVTALLSIPSQDSRLYTQFLSLAFAQMVPYQKLSPIIPKELRDHSWWGSGIIWESQDYTQVNNMQGKLPGYLFYCLLSTPIPLFLKWCFPPVSMPLSYIFLHLLPDIYLRSSIFTHKLPDSKKWFYLLYSQHLVQSLVFDL